MIGRHIGFTRWHDRIPELSQAVKMLEAAEPHIQQMIAEVIIGSNQLHQVTSRSEHGLKKLGTEKVMGLMKSKGKRRWYDKDPKVHLAFSYIFLMEDVLRYEIAIKIIVVLRALEETDNLHPEAKQAGTLVKAIFSKPLHVLMSSMIFTLNPRQIGDTPAQDIQSPEEGSNPIPEISHSTLASSDGMKIIRLKRTH